MTDSKRLRSLSRQRAFIAAVFDFLADAADELKQIEQEPATEGLVQEALWGAEDLLRSVVEAIADTEYRLVQQPPQSLLVGG